MTIVDDVRAELHAAAMTMPEPFGGLALRARNAIDSLNGGLAKAKSANERAKIEAEEAKATMIAAHNVSHNADKRVKLMWLQMHDLRSLLVDAEEFMPVEGVAARERIARAINLIENANVTNQPAPPAKEISK